MTKRIAWLITLGLIAAGPLAGQAPPAPAPAGNPPEAQVASPDTTAPAAAPAPAVGSVPRRISWTSDATPLRVGDIVTVVVDEQTAARERVSNVGQERRTLNGSLSVDANGKASLKATGVESGWNNDSRNVGEANRLGDLTGTLSTRVVAVTPGGLAEIEGKKSVSVDGREQTMTLHGFVRPEDVTPDNVVCSVRIADATIKYQGKKMGPKTSILGRILSILWP